MARRLTEKTSPKKAKSKGGRPPRPSGVEQDSIALARKLGHSALGRAVQALLDALEANKPIFRKEDDGEGNSAYIPQEDVPDHAIRIRAAAELCDRFGLPKKVEAETGDPFSGFMLAVSAVLKAERDDAS